MIPLNTPPYMKRACDKTCQIWTTKSLNTFIFTTRLSIIIVDYTPAIYEYFRAYPSIKGDIIFTIFNSSLERATYAAMVENIDRETRAEFEKLKLNEIRITENELGRGSYAVVMEVEYRGLKCAGKKLHRSLRDAAASYTAGITYAARRYVGECKLLSNSRHPNIVQFMGIYFRESFDFPILVMEFLPINLTKCLETYFILSDEISYSILHDVSLGLAYLHSQTPPIIHRDLSGNNVLLDANMTAKISDLGVAKIVNMNPLEQDTESPGTQAFMPPEVMVPDPHYGVAVDQFSFGTLMLQVFTAEWPAPTIGPTTIDPNNPQGLIANSEIKRRENLINKIQGHLLQDLVLDCLSNNPELRPNITVIVAKMKDMFHKYKPTYENKVEALRRIDHQVNITRQLQEEVQQGFTAFNEKEIECKKIQQALEEELACLATKLQSIESHLTVRPQVLLNTLYLPFSLSLIIQYLLL